MIFAIILLFSALAISAVAAYFSIVGLTLIFSGAPLQIAIMGAVLELGKLVSASFVYRSWRRINLAMRIYFVSSVVILSIITSLGIFGYLSKSYISDSASIYSNETKLKTQEELLSVERQRLDNLLKQQTQRADPNRRIERQIDEVQSKIYTLTTQIGELKSERNALGTEIGPIRYIAQLIYGDDKLDTVDSAVRIIILSLMFVFDPLAILLVIAANMQMKSAQKGTPPKPSKEPRQVRRVRKNPLTKFSKSINIDKSEVLDMTKKNL